MIIRFLRRFTIRVRVIGLVIGLMILITGLFALMIGNQLSVANKLAQIADFDTQAERSLLLASMRMQSARINLMRYMSDRVPNPSEALGDVEQAKDLLNQAMLFLSSSDHDQSIEAAIKEMEEYQTLIGKVQMARSAEMTDSFNALAVDAYQKELDIEQRIETIVAVNAQLMDQENNAELARVQRNLTFIMLGYIGLVGLALIAAIWLVRSITRAVNLLTVGTEALSAGNMEASVPVNGQDELSWLARSFNQMTAQIAKSYTGLEQRVVDRTQAAEGRALQLQVASEIARDAASVSELDSLLFRAVNLIRDRFDFYYVSIFLLDDLGKHAVLRSATGDAGRSLLQRGYKVRVGEVGIIGYTTGMGAPRIINDVEADFVYRKDVMLPETRSEMALPLKVGKVVIGALDVQSSKMNAFGEDDISALQILADQLAVAIKNMRLVNELEDRLSEINTLYRRYTQESLTRISDGSQKLGFQYDLLSLQAGQQRFTPDVITKLRKGNKVVVQEEVLGTMKSRLLTPLMLYDQMIGVLGFDQDDPDHKWSDNEIMIIEAVSNQVILALDNARLLDETQLRTDQLRLLQDVTATAAAHTSLRELLENVTQKLRRGLDMERCAITLVDADGLTATRVAVASIHPIPPGAMTLGVKTTLASSDIFRQTVEKKKSMVFRDENGALFLTSGTGIPSQPPIFAIVTIPLVAHDSVVGWITLEIADPERKISEDELQLFDQLGMQISTAIEVARNIERSTTRAEREKMISEVTARMRETLDVETVLKTAVEEIFNSGEYAEVSLYLSTDESVGS